MEATVVQILAKFRADVSEFNKRVGDVETQLKSLEKTTSQTGKDVSDTFAKMENAAGNFLRTLGTVSAVGGAALVALGMKSFQTAATVQELDTVMQVVGSTTGKTYEALLETANAIRSNGIEMASAQQMAIKFAKNSLNLADAADIARTAQDLAVISQSNSTDTANRLTHAVLNLNSMMLRNAGVQTTVSQAVRRYSQENNIAVKSMTTAQKQQAVVNAILEEGKKIAGVYSMSMNNAGKVLRSFARISSDIQGEVGKPLIEAFGPLILQVYELYKNFSLLIREGGALEPIIKAATAVMTQLITPITNVVTKVVDFVKNMKPMKSSINDIGTVIQRYLPVIAGFGSALAVIGGKQLLQGVPVLQGFANALNPVATGLLVLVALSPQIQAAFANLMTAMKPLLPVFGELFDRIVSLGNIVINAFAGAINMIAGVIRRVTDTVNDWSGALDFLTAVVIAAAIVGIALLTKKIWQAVAAKAALYAEVILVVGAIALLIYGLMKAWNSSETFRKVVLNMAEAFLGLAEAVSWGVGWIVKGLSHIARAAANALIAWGKLKGDDSKVKTGEGILRGIDETWKTLDSITGSINNFRYRFKNMKDDLNKPLDWTKALQGSGKFTAGLDKIKEIFSGKAAEGGGADEGDGLTGAVDNTIRNMEKVLQAFQEFIQFEFTPGLMKGGEDARNTINRALGLLENIFEEKAKGLEKSAVLQLREQYNKAADAIREDYLPGLMALSDELVSVEKNLEEAQKRLESSLEAGRKIGGLLRQPFGEASELDKAMGTATATVDGVINLYDNLVELIETRFTDVKDPRKAPLLQLIESQISAIIPLIKERDKLIERIATNKQERDSALAKRLEAGAGLRELFASPFGKPSELSQALNSAEASADSVISMYQRLVNIINNRFEGLDDVAQADKSKLIDFLTKETSALLAVVEKRNRALLELEKAQEALTNIISEQQSFAKSVTSGLRSYANVLAKVSDEESSSIIHVIKTATGMVITQVKKSGSALDSIQTQLRERLANIRSFATNVNALLSRGLNREYLRQLIEAGPESAGLTLQALVGATGDQISEINSIYDQIFGISEQFGDSIAGQFYGAGKNMAEGLVSGAKSAVDSLSKEMKEISDSILEKLSPLMDDLYVLGTDSFAALVKQDEERLEKLNTEMEVLKEAMKEALAPLNAIGKTAGDDMMNGLVKALEASKEELRTKINEVAGIIISQMQSAAFSIRAVIAALADLKAAQAVAAEVSSDKKKDDSLLPPPAVPVPSSSNSNNSSFTNNNNGDINIQTQNLDMAQMRAYLERQYLSGELLRLGAG